MSGAMPRIAVVYFADPPTPLAPAAEIGAYMLARHQALVGSLAARGCEVVGSEGRPITGLEERTARIDALKREGVQAVVIACWRWSQPMAVVDFVRRLDLPVALFGHQEGDANGVGAMSAHGAALWEVAPNRAALIHLRIRDDVDELARWARGVAAYQRLRRSRLLLWGGTVCLGMEHLLDDLSRLKAFLIGDVLNEGQYYLIKRAEAYLAEGAEIARFLAWLDAHKTQIRYDDRILTRASLAKQIALYLAAEARLDEHGREHIAGVSVLCQDELSIEYGVTACLIPAFVPFHENHRGPKAAIPAVCEGDVKSLITGVLLSDVSGGTPPQFGDLREIRDAPRWLVIGNCGASSVFHAANSRRAAEALPQVVLQPQIIGAAGACVTWKGRAGRVTVARLCRVRGRYFMHLGVGQAIEVTDEIMGRRRWAWQFPTTVVDLGVSVNDFLRVAASNHYLMVPGDVSAEIGHACAQAAVPVLRIDTPDGIASAVATMTGAGAPAGGEAFPSFR